MCALAGRRSLYGRSAGPHSIADFTPAQYDANQISYVAREIVLKCKCICCFARNSVNEAAACRCHNHIQSVMFAWIYSLNALDHGGDVACAKTIIDIHNAHVGSAGVEHAQQGRKAVE